MDLATVDFKSASTLVIPSKKTVKYQSDFMINSIRTRHDLREIDPLQDLFLISDKLIYITLLLFIYFFVALEEVDYQLLSFSKSYIESEVEYDEWSI